MEVIERTNVTVIFTNIRTSKSPYYLLYDKFHSKTHTTIIPFSIVLQSTSVQDRRAYKEETVTSHRP